MSRYIKLKEFIRQIHLISGLTAGIFIFLICLSGTILTFEKEIDALFNPGHLTLEEFTSKPLPIETLRTELEETLGGKVESLSIPSEKNAPYTFNIKMSPEERRGKPYFVNQFTKEILNKDHQKSGFFFFFFRLHRWLLLNPQWGSPMVGASTLIFILLLFSGFYLWWPKSIPHLKNSLKVRVKQNWKRINYDLHNTLGFYSLIFLLVMSLTGLCWSFEWYRVGMSSVIGAEIFGDRKTQPTTVVPNGETITFEDVLKSVNQALSYSGKVTIVLAKNRESALTVMKTPSDPFTIKYTDHLHIDPYSGNIVKIDRFSDRTIGRKITSLIKPLHTGEFFGMISKIIYFITCLIATSLPITGLYIWLNKSTRKKEK